MSPFRRSLFGYRRADVDLAFAAREREVLDLQVLAGRRAEALAVAERETTELSRMVIEREREMRDLDSRLSEAQASHDRSIAVLDAVTSRLEQLEAQARGQATRIRMKALREAVEVSRRVQALSEAADGGAEASAAPADAKPAAEPVDPAAEASRPIPETVEPIDFDGLFEGQVKLEIGPLGDFSQLVGFEDAIGELGASEISVERFSEGRATLSMHLDEPVDLLRELEGRSAQDFKVRHTAPDNLVLDLDEDDPEQHAA